MQSCEKLSTATAALSRIIDSGKDTGLNPVTFFSIRTIV